MRHCCNGFLRRVEPGRKLIMKRTPPFAPKASFTKECCDIRSSCPFVVDKHSTGGIGDKTSLILAPLVACTGCWVPMVSGRGLGITGGTLDKLESIPGFNVHISLAEAAAQLERIGVVMMGQTDRFCPADKKLYALRDVTGTVPSIPLITASIMSKKMADSLDRLVLDVKFGSGVFMKTRKDAEILAASMIAVGKEMSVKVHTILNSMNTPFFPRLRSGPRAVSGASRTKQIPSSTMKNQPTLFPIKVCAILLPLMIMCPITTATSLALVPEMPEFPVYSANVGPALRSFYLSSEQGSDANDGRSPERPWQSFQHLKNLRLQPGDRIYLRRGDKWSEEIILSGGGSEGNAVVISNYGDETAKAPQINCPSIDPHLRTEAYPIDNGKVMEIPIGGFKGITLRKSSHVKIDGIDFKGGKAGIYIQQSGRAQVGFQVVNCRFNGIAAHPDQYFYENGIKALGQRITEGRGDRVFWNAAIFIGGSLGDFDYAEGNALVTGVTVTDCRFIGCDTEFATAFYWPKKPNAVLIRNVTLMRSIAYGSLQGSFMLNNVAGAFIKDFHVYSGGGFSSSGVCGAFLQSCSDIDIVECAFNGITRQPHWELKVACHDGVGLDLEGACVNVRILRCSFVGNAGAGLMICNTDSEIDEYGRAKNPNKGIVIEGCVFDRNCLNPDSVDSPERSGQSNFQILSWQPNATGRLHRNVYLRSQADAGALSPNLDGFARR